MAGDLNNRKASPETVVVSAGAEFRVAGAPDALADERQAHAGIPMEELERIVQSRHDMPFRILGPHSFDDGRSTVVRAFLPQAERVVLRVLGENAEAYSMQRLHPDGLFEVQVPRSCTDYEYLVTDAEGISRRASDAYRFPSFRFREGDERPFVGGRHSGLHQKLGARISTHNGVAGVAFAVWAPHARRVSVVGHFNGWDGRRHPMQRVLACGIWELFVPDLRPGALYKYEIKTGEGAVFMKGDPFALRTEASPNLASIVDDLDRHVWDDEPWMRHGRLATVRERGVHAYPWPLNADASDSRSLDALLAKILDAGYTFVELPSWETGRESASLFAFGPPFAAPNELMTWVDACHRRGLGVLWRDSGDLFPAALSHLAWFDGTRLFDRNGGEETDRTLLFDRTKGEVRSVLLSTAMFWVDQYHIDAIRTDQAGARMLADLLVEVRDRVPGFRLLMQSDIEEPKLPADDNARIVAGRHDDPFSVLGLQRTEVRDANEDDAQSSARGETEAEVVVRAMLPDATDVQVLSPDHPELVHEMRRIDDAGLFEVQLPDEPAGYRLRAFEQDGASREIIDPYAFRDFTFGPQDQHLFGAGNHYRIYERLGAHLAIVNGVAGVVFAVWAPNAEGVGVVGPFNHWNGLAHQMRRHGVSGVWEIFVPGITEGENYNFEIRAAGGQKFLKTDPYAFYTEVPPATGSVVCELKGAHAWQDSAWLAKRRASNPWREPMAIYEVHLGSWMRGGDDRPLSYREIATKMVPYVKALGFTHIELMPIAEHPYEPSWGYQVSNFYAPTSRFGTPGDLMAFVDHCHAAGLGVILDWVPGHFPKDAHALALFDGTHLYEHDDPRKGEHPDWGTLIFNYGRHEVENFLIANALFWLETYHFDGLRVDAVASMLYLDYSRPAYGGWIPNVHGGNENLEAIEFLKHTNSVLHARFPGILMIAEESTSWPNVSRPAHHGGLGFGFKWNMGWMHDTLAYFSTPIAERKHHHGKLTFPIMYAFSENFILSLSHDEVVHLKRSLLNKMPGEKWEKFANLRLLFALMYAHPGKKLLFMGAELGQEREWDHERGLDWNALKDPANRALGWFLQDLNRLYCSEAALHEADFQAAGFEWLEVDNAEESIIAFLRKAKDPRESLLFAANFSGVSRPGHRLGVPYPVAYTQLFSSNARRYGGFDVASSSPRSIQAEENACHGREFSIQIDLPALSAVILQPAPPQAY